MYIFWMRQVSLDDHVQLIVDKCKSKIAESITGT